MSSERVQFFKMGTGRTSEKVLLDVLAPIEEDRDFYKMARPALMSHRGDKKVPEWPDAVRLMSVDGKELYRWTMWDEFHAHQREVQDAHRKSVMARRAALARD